MATFNTENNTKFKYLSMNDIPVNDVDMSWAKATLMLCIYPMPALPAQPPQAS